MYQKLYIRSNGQAYILYVLGKFIPSGTLKTSVPQ
jgi:hypothetical protein